MTRALIVLLLALGCSSPSRPALEIHVTAEGRAVVDAYVEFLPWDPVRVVISADPAAAVAGYQGADLRIAVVDDLDDGCVDCYRLERIGGAFVVHGDAALGVQYGLTDLLEETGFRFFHPYHPTAPATLAIPEAVDGATVAPEMSVRGLHLHTLHPIEGYFAFWSPSERHLEDARRIADWVVKNRGNELEWVALDNIQDDAATAEAWRAHTATILADLHLRGLHAGLSVQIFGASNLQAAFDLVDEDPLVVPVGQQIAARLPLILDGLPFDHISLSFGEFFGADPATFVAAIDATYDELQAVAPGIEVTASIHVGDSLDQRVDYMGENLQYYFLVKFANPAIVHKVHTVMYYDLFEDTGGAYHHDDFAEHRAYLFERLAAGDPVIYYPESAYWVAFDVSVPMYLPLYVRSRWLDMSEIRATATAGGFPDLDQHVLFSSGWEWGYWQNDAATLRMNHTLPARWEDFFEEWFAPDVAAAIIALTTLQHQALIVDRLAAYVASRDLYIDVGDDLDIIAQPDRVRFEELAGMDGMSRLAFEQTVVGPLETFASGIGAIAAMLPASSTDPWVAEVIDGVAIDATRARFIAALYRAALAHTDAMPTAAHVAAAEVALAEAQTIVARRAAAFHAPQPIADEIRFPGPNATIYGFGYLEKADTLCYWHREYAEVQTLLGSADPIPACVF